MSQLAVKYMTSYTQHLLNVIFNDSLNCLCLFGVTCTTLKSDKTSFVGTICWATSKGLLFIGPPCTSRAMCCKWIRDANCPADYGQASDVSVHKLYNCLSFNKINSSYNIRLVSRYWNIIQKWWEVIFNHKKKHFLGRLVELPITVT